MLKHLDRVLIRKSGYNGIGTILEHHTNDKLFIVAQDNNELFLVDEAGCIPLTGTKVITSSDEFKKQFDEFDRDLRTLIGFAAMKHKIIAARYLRNKFGCPLGVAKELVEDCISDYIKQQTL